MTAFEIPDPVFRDAVAAIDTGDVGALERLLELHPRLATDRLDGDAVDRLDAGEGYFRRPYLLWFVAENPVRTGRLPANVGAVTRVLLENVAARRTDPARFREQVDYALELVSSGRVPRESGAQGELIDLLVDAGADPNPALVCALAYRELDAAERLLARGARMTLLAAVCTGRTEEARRLARSADGAELRTALAGGALHGRAELLSLLIATGADVGDYGPPGFHAHATALHHAVDSGSLDAVRVLVEAGADLAAKDRVHHGTPLDWADYLGRREIAAYLRGTGG